ncbi:uncharacterized protein DNG_03001 [Cephalotrichum gorgonifer]|uniref:Altered inheritance of mitochondria protein 11 n=1 Tax=Cephalotrichum gorgonifer TaxID=2041049 RepID=A0AAE8ST84_9PEZI|nr:uncharacterized protein DNG_03001 [Cephalotrichum gorgonifer]
MSQQSELPRPRSFTDPRALKQLGLFVAGSAFMLASIAVTRRSVVRKQVAAIPKSFQPNLRSPATTTADGLRGGAADPSSAEGSVMAAQALGLATLNVLSFAVMATGGVAYAFDLSNVDDLKRYARARMYGPAGRPDEAAEREMEEWVARVLSKAGIKDDGAGKAAGKKEESEK